MQTTLWRLSKNRRNNGLRQSLLKWYNRAEIAAVAGFLKIP
jgi:hypothetical protein